MTDLIVFNQWTPIAGCSSGGAQAMLPISEAIAVIDVNMLAPLSQTPASLASAVTLSVNGRGFFNVASPPDFSVSGNAITWLSTEYSVSPGDDVVANYFYVEANPSPTSSQMSATRIRAKSQEPKSVSTKSVRSTRPSAMTKTGKPMMQ